MLGRMSMLARPFVSTFRRSAAPDAAA